MRSLTDMMRRGGPAATSYQLTDLLHGCRTACVPVDAIAGTVAAWLAELDAHSPLVADLARLVRDGDWPAAHAIAELLSIDVAVAAENIDGSRH